MDDLLKELEGTSLCEKIKEAGELYKEIEIKEDRFCGTFGIHCRKNCGSCCEHFEPDVTEIEALYLAYGLIKEGRADEILNENIPDDGGDHCPFYDKEKFCTVYPYRPLVCRLFNACASNDKYGNPAFRKCKWNDGGKGISPKEFSEHPEDVITMEEFGERIFDDESDEKDTVLLLDAVRKAIERILLVLEMKGQEK